MNVTFGIYFFILSNVKINFDNYILNLRLYTTGKIFFTTIQVKLIEKKEFVTATLTLNKKTLIVYITSLASLDPNVHLLYIVPIAWLKADKTPIAILSKYTNFINIFFLDLVVKLL